MHKSAEEPQHYLQVLYTPRDSRKITRHIRFDLFGYRKIEWEESDLRKALQIRLREFSNNKVSSLATFCDTEPKATIDDTLVRFADERKSRTP
jgi:hypothetical protein